MAEVSGVYKLFLAGGMLVAGSINTLTTKTADMVNTTGRPDFPPHPFTHPYLQALGMFIGEFSCLVVFYLLRCYQKINRPTPVTNTTENTDTQIVNPLLFWLPAVCDMCATSTVYFGLSLTYASSFQMLRGSVIIFTTIFSILFFKRKYFGFQWLGMLFVICGLLVVGLADVLYSKNVDFPIQNIIMGDTMIVLAQIITACQICVEEKFIKDSGAHPLQVVGWEGFWGMLTISCLLYPLSHLHIGPKFAPNTPYHTLEDVVDGLLQMKNDHTIIFATAGNMVSIACFNFFSISVTKNFSGTTRMVFDSMRTVIVWGASLGLGWQSFIPVQLIGFASLILGMAWFNSLLLPKCLQIHEDAIEEEDEPLLEAGDNSAVQEADEDHEILQE